MSSPTFYKGKDAANQADKDLQFYYDELNGDDNPRQKITSGGIIAEAAVFNTVISTLNASTSMADDEQTAAIIF